MIKPEQVGPFQVAAVPAFSDNYLWLMKGCDEVAVVDPGDGEAVLAAADALGWRITHILNTHWHGDHTGGNVRVKEATGATIYGPAGEAEKIPGIDHALNEGETLNFGGERADIWHIPGHTLGHIAYVFRGANIAFVGDTIFAMGCGRLFEGSPQQMYGSLQRFTGLPGDMKLYCAHEYTLSNARFADHSFPADPAIADRLASVSALRDAGQRTVPTTVADEIATNPFLRAANADEFAVLRAAKDQF